MDSTTKTKWLSGRNFVSDFYRDLKHLLTNVRQRLLPAIGEETVLVWEMLGIGKRLAIDGGNRSDDRVEIYSSRKENDGTRQK